MASVHKDNRRGKIQYRIQFYDKDKRRRSVRLAGVNKKAAEAIRVKLEDLLAASISGASPCNETAAWLATVGTDMAKKLNAAGFGEYVPKRETAKLGAFLKTYIEGRKSEVTVGTIVNFHQLETNLKLFFGADCDMRSISEGDADEWRQQLVPQYAAATLSKYVKRARQFFKSAMRKGVVDINPFTDVKGGSEHNDDRKRFVSLETTAKVLDSCPDTEWRAIIALARIGGVRTPSETLGLRWADIDWANDRFTVTSPKTKKQGKPWRVVPLFPELRVILEDAFDQAADGAEFVISRYRERNCNLRTQFLRILKRAGVEPWPRLFQNLRASRETELANTFPIHVVTSWLGNTPAVAAKHYLQTTDDHFRQAVVEPPKSAESWGATWGAIGGEKGVQQGVLTPSARDRQQHPFLHYLSKKTAENTVFTGVSGGFKVTPTGLEPVLPA